MVLKLIMTSNLSNFLQMEHELTIIFTRTMKCFENQQANKNKSHLLKKYFSTASDLSFACLFLDNSVEYFCLDDYC